MSEMKVFTGLSYSVMNALWVLYLSRLLDTYDPRSFCAGSAVRTGWDTFWQQPLCFPWHMIPRQPCADVDFESFVSGVAKPPNAIGICLLIGQPNLGNGWDELARWLQPFQSGNTMTSSCLGYLSSSRVLLMCVSARYRACCELQCYSQKAHPLILQLTQGLGFLGQHKTLKISGWPQRTPGWVHNFSQEWYVCFIMNWNQLGPDEFDSNRRPQHSP